MEENLQNDKFEEFLKKALENYEENPPESVWRGVGAAMPEPGIPQAAGGGNFFGNLKNTAFGVRKMVAVMSLPLAILLGLAYYQHKTQEETALKLQKELAAITSELKTARAQQSEMLSAMQQRLEALEAQQAPTTQQSKVGRSATGEYMPSFDARKIANVAESTQATAIISPAYNKVALGADASASPILGEARSEAPTTAMLANTPTTTTPRQQSWTPTSLASLPMIEQKPTLSLENNQKIPSAVTPITKVFNMPQKKWEIGLTSMWLTKQHKLPTRKEQDPGGPGGGPDLEREPNKNFDSKGWATGVHVARRINNSLSIVSGLKYLQLSNKQCFEPKFRFDHGHQHGGGGGPQDPEAFDFNLELQVPGYEVGLTLRAEEVDTAQMHHPDDDLEMKLVTSQVISSLQLPLLAQYSLTRGRTSLFLSGGLVGEYQLSNKLTIDNINIQNNEFKLTGMQPPTEKKQLEDIYALHYQIGFGLKYQLSSKIGLQLQGNMVNSLAQRFDDDFLKGSNSMRGLQANIVYQL